MRTDPPPPSLHWVLPGHVLCPECDGFGEVSGPRRAEDDWDTYGCPCCGGPGQLPADEAAEWSGPPPLEPPRPEVDFADELPF